MPQTSVTVYVSNLPVNSVIMWYGASQNIPEKWKICDGSNGTPNLTGRFVLGASNSHPVYSTGGSETVTLTTDQIPAHSHNLNCDGAEYGIYKQKGNEVIFPTNAATTTGNTGGGQAHNNMPPFYALYYIMKVSN